MLHPNTPCSIPHPANIYPTLLIPTPTLLIPTPNAHGHTGLEGQAARDCAREKLLYILPESTLKEIREEEDLLEEIRNRTWSIVKLGVKGEIECTKMLIAETGLPRPKAKGLLLRAKEVLVEEDKAYARTEPLMRTKVSH